MLNKIGLFLSVIFLFSCNQSEYPQGKSLYDFHCESCHGKDGLGLKKLYPPIADSDYYLDNIGDLPCLIQNGMNATIRVNGITYEQEMPSFPKLSPTEISNLINFMNHTWHPDLSYQTLNATTKALESCE